MEWGTGGDPGVIFAAGDWHGDEPWAVFKIRAAGRRFDKAHEQHRLLIHAGDFGFYRAGARFPRYLAAVSNELRRIDATALVVDGNHEDHEWLQEIAVREMTAGRGAPFLVAPRVYWAPRGFRWTWHGRMWMALGGGVSVNRARLTEGWDWFPAEAITPLQAAAAIGGGPADVIVSHDVPSGVHLALPPPEPGWELADLARADAHRDILQDIGEATRPGFWWHGHMHVSYARTLDLGWGPVQVTGLSRNRARGNTALLDVRTMDWTPFE